VQFSHLHSFNFRFLDPTRSKEDRLFVFVSSNNVLVFFQSDFLPALTLSASGPNAASSSSCFRSLLFTSGFLPAIRLQIDSLLRPNLPFLSLSLSLSARTCLTFLHTTHFHRSYLVVRSHFFLSPIAHFELCVLISIPSTFAANKKRDLLDLFARFELDTNCTAVLLTLTWHLGQSHLGRLPWSLDKSEHGRQTRPSFVTSDLCLSFSCFHAIYIYKVCRLDVASLL
jgi:hypothetical protein